MPEDLLRLSDYAMIHNVQIKAFCVHAWSAESFESLASSTSVESIAYSKIITEFNSNKNKQTVKSFLSRIECDVVIFLSIQFTSSNVTSKLRCCECLFSRLLMALHIKNPHFAMDIEWHGAI